MVGGVEGVDMVVVVVAIAFLVYLGCTNYGFGCRYTVVVVVLAKVVVMVVVFFLKIEGQ